MHFDVQKFWTSKWARRVAVLIGAGVIALLVIIALRPDGAVTNPLPQPGGGPGAIVPRAPETGELWRQPVFAADGVSIVELKVAYVDGRLGTFFYGKDGHLERFVCDFPPGGERARYEARFALDGKVIGSSVTTRADGSVMSTYKLSADGVEEVRHYRQDGTLSGEEITYLDGSRRSASSSDNGKDETNVSFVGPSTETVSVPTPTDSLRAHFEVKLKGVRAEGWDYVSAAGKVEHSAKYLASGDLEFTFFDEDGTATHRQVWRLTGKDWKRGYYVLVKVVELYFDGERVYRELELYPDEKTVRIARHFRSDGSLDEVRHYDRQGNGVKTDHFNDWNGKYSYTSYPSWWSWSELVDDSFLADPGHVLPPELGYRLRGDRFGQLELKDAVEFDPVLIVKKAP